MTERMPEMKHRKNLVEKGLANTVDTRYNALKRKSETQDVKPTTQTGSAGERGK